MIKYLTPLLAVALTANAQNSSSTTNRTWTSAALAANATPIRAIDCNNNVAVAVGRNGQIHYSLDGLKWTRAVSPATGDLNSVDYDPTTRFFYATGNHGLMLSSSNGTAWSEVTTNNSDNLNGVARANKHLFATGSGRTFLRSGNGTNWISNRFGKFPFTSALSPAPSSSLWTKVLANLMVFSNTTSGTFYFNPNYNNTDIPLVDNILVDNTWRMGVNTDQVYINKQVGFNPVGSDDVILFNLVDSDDGIFLKTTNSMPEGFQLKLQGPDSEDGKNKISVFTGEKGPSDTLYYNPLGDNLDFTFINMIVSVDGKPRNNVSLLEPYIGKPFAYRLQGSDSIIIGTFQNGEVNLSTKNAISFASPTVNPKSIPARTVKIQNAAGLIQTQIVAGEPRGQVWLNQSGNSTWQPLKSPAATTFGDATFFNNQVFLSAANGNLYRTPPTTAGLSWGAVITGTKHSLRGLDARADTAKQLTAVGRSGTIVTYTSNGTSRVETILNGRPDLFDVVFFKNRWIAVGSQGARGLVVSTSQR